MTNLFESQGMLCKLANTSVRCQHGAFIVRYYETDILTYWPENGMVSLYTGGNNTKSTLKRMNQALAAIGLDATVQKQKDEIYIKFKDSNICITFIYDACEFNSYTHERYD